MNATNQSKKNRTPVQPPIVIVEDDRALARILQKILHKAGYNSKWFSSGSEAIEWLCSNSCMLMLLDFQLPDMTGKQLIESLAERNCNVVFIVMTGYGHPKLVVQMMKLGARDYLIKEKGFLDLVPTVVKQVIEQLQIEQRLVEAEQTLHESEERLKLAVQGSSDGLWDWPDVNMDKEWWSSRFYELLGYKDGEFQAGLSKFKEILHSDDLERIIEAMKAHFEDRVPFDVEYRFKTKSGEYRWFRGRGQAVWDEEGHPTRMSGSIQDIHVRVESERILQESYKQTEHLLTSISSILIGVGRNDKIARWNQAAENSFGIAAIEAIGTAFVDCGIEWDWPDVLEHISYCCDRDEPVRIDDVRYTRPDGKEGFLDLTINLIAKDDTKHAGYLILAADITERKILERQLSQAQKLESIGQLAAGIAHEINTPTQYIGDNTNFLQIALGNLQNVLAKYGDLLAAAKQDTVSKNLIAEVEAEIENNRMDYILEQIPQAIAESLVGVERVGKIVKAMKEYAHPGGDQKTPADINSALENTITVCRNEWKYHSDMEKDFDENLPLVQCMLGEVNQAFLNLIVNAAQAITDTVEENSGKKGVIRVSTRHCEEFAEIKISDTGRGIPKEHQAKIFDPFFTTKEVGKGTGQGLAITHNIVVEKHGGSITFETEEGKGTTFVVRLPINCSN